MMRWLLPAAAVVIVGCAQDREPTVADPGWFPDIVPIRYDGTPPPPPAQPGELLCTIQTAQPYPLLTCVEHDVSITWCVFDRTRTACSTLLGGPGPTPAP